jgi:hypothetical protein
MFPLDSLVGKCALTSISCGGVGARYARCVCHGGWNEWKPEALWFLSPAFVIRVENLNWLFNTSVTNETAAAVATAEALLDSVKDKAMNTDRAPDPLFGGLFGAGGGDVAMDGTGWLSFFSTGYNGYGGDANGNGDGANMGAGDGGNGRPWSHFSRFVDTSSCHRKGAWDLEAALVYGTFKVAYFALCVILIFGFRVTAAFLPVLASLPRLQQVHKPLSQCASTPHDVQTRAHSRCSRRNVSAVPPQSVGHLHGPDASKAPLQAGTPASMLTCLSTC